MASGSRKWILWFVLIVLIIPAMGIAAYTWAAVKFAYSNGQRAGYVQKFAHKGWVCKTWEGELQMVNVPGSAPQIFQFSVPDDAVADKINRLMGQRVALSYEQHKGVPSKCFAETEYWIVDVRPLQ